jgi:uncharacterized protein YjbJ (UPF0337 family)
MTTMKSRVGDYSYIYAGKWHKLKGGARQALGKLAGSESTQIAGQQEYMLGALQEKYGYTRKEAQRALADLATTVEAKKGEMKDVLHSAKAWIDEKRGVTPKATKTKRAVAGIAAAVTATAALAYYLGWFRPESLPSQS